MSEQPQPHPDDKAWAAFRLAFAEDMVRAKQFPGIRQAWEFLGQQADLAAVEAALAAQVATRRAYWIHKLIANTDCWVRKFTTDTDSEPPADTPPATP